MVPNAEARGLLKIVKVLSKRKKHYKKEIYIRKKHGASVLPKEFKTLYNVTHAPSKKFSNMYYVRK